MKTKLIVSVLLAGSIAGGGAVACTSHSPASPKPTQTAPLSIALWDVQQGGGSALNQLHTDLLAIQSDGTADNAPALIQDAKKLVTDVQAARAVGPIPNPIVQAHWAKALDDLDNYAGDAITAVQTNDTNLVQTAVSFAKDATYQLNAAAAAVTG